MQAGEHLKASATVKTIELGEYRLNYAVEGSGPYMVMLHGADKREDWSVWTPLMDLSRQYTLVMPDLIGFGASSRPVETPEYGEQARILHEMLDKLSIPKAILVGTSWGGQVALEFAINWPERVESMVLISSTYDKSQLARLKKVGRPALIIWAEDDLVAQVKAGYVLRDAIKTAKIQVLDPVAKNPHFDFTIAHKLERYRKDVILSMIKDFLSDPQGKIAEPPELEPELRGMAMKEEKESKE
jgi:pimeloyl-ACP methyl ester carboxylesterase